MRAWHKGSGFGPGLRICMAVADRALFRVKLKLSKGCRRLTAAARDVGQVLVNMLGEDGRLDPCHQTLADLVGCTVRTVQRALDQLRQEGFVTWERRIARRAADGSFTVVGRSKEFVISGGENIHPAEIDEALAAHPAVLECAAFGLADARWGEVVAVAVVRREGQAVTEAELAAHLAPRLARFKQPRRWFFVEALPKTALGKVRRVALAALAADVDALARPHAARGQN